MASNIAEVMSSVLFFLLLSYALVLAIFLVDLDAVNGFNILYAYGVLTTFTNFVFQLIIYCRLSENITDDLFASGDLFYESPWYRLPPKLQKLYMLPIQRSQQEFRLSGFGIIECSMRICAAVSYVFLILFICKIDACFEFLADISNGYFLLFADEEL